MNERPSIADVARACAVNVEAKKDGLAQLQDGSWVLKLKVHPVDMPVSLMQAAMGTRYVVALVEINDAEQPVPPKAAAKPATAPKVKTKTDASIPWGQMSLAQQAGMLCNEVSFQTFVVESLGATLGDINPAEDAAVAVRRACGVKTRREIVAGSPAAAKWRELVADYRAWERYPQ